MVIITLNPTQAQFLLTTLDHARQGDRNRTQESVLRGNMDSALRNAQDGQRIDLIMAATRHGLMAADIDPIV